MKLARFSNKVGYASIIWRKRFFLFGEKRYFVKSRIHNKYTDVNYVEFGKAKEMFELLKSILIREQKNPVLS